VSTSDFPESRHRIYFVLGFLRGLTCMTAVIVIGCEI